MPLQPRQTIRELPEIVHGGIYYAKLNDLKISSRDVLDFSVSHNPYGTPPNVLAALRSIPVDSYPDPEAEEFRKRLGKRLGVKPANLLAGSGSTELIRLVTIAYFASGDLILIPQPTYSEYEIACRMMDVRVVKKPVLREEKHFLLESVDLLSCIGKFKPKGVFLCNPNNPTGQCLTRDEIEKILLAVPDCLFVVDEAYIAFTENENRFSSLGLIHHGNIIVIRSMTKDYALAGLRLGYAVAASSIIEVLKRICPPWNVNIAAQLAGIAALDSENYLENCKTKINQAKGFLMSELSSMGLIPVPSQANFFLVKVGDAKSFHKALLERGLLVRDCSSFGLPEYIRIAPRTMPECIKLITAIREVISGQHTNSNNSVHTKRNFWRQRKRW